MRTHFRVGEDVEKLQHEIVHGPTGHLSKKNTHALSLCLVALGWDLGIREYSAQPGLKTTAKETAQVGLGARSEFDNRGRGNSGLNFVLSKIGGDVR